MSSEDYFELKYNEEINELLNECKELLNHYQVTLSKKNDHMDFLYFIMNSVIIHYNESESDSEDDDYLNEKKYKI